MKHNIFSNPIALSSITAPRRWCGSNHEEESVGSAEWKTSDFVVTLMEEQQVPVYLSAQAVPSACSSLNPDG